MKIGSYTLKPFKPGMPILTLAPLAGVGNWVFRLICARLGARLVGVEFINCRVISHNSRKSKQLLDFSDALIYAKTGMSLLAAQIYGNDIDLIAAGAQEFEQRGAQVVDINFGCSVPRILQKGCGAAYLRDLDLLYRAVRTTVDAVQVPVIVKTRIGWDDDSINLLEVVRRVEAAGAQAIGIHARTVAQKYKGRASWEWIARAKEIATIPVLGNGDVFSYEDAVAMQRQTGCDAVMIGRAAMANPWIFSAQRGASLRARIDLAMEQLQFMAQYKGERVGVLETRKHLALYFKGLSRASEMRQQLLTTDSLQDLIDLLSTWRETLVPDNDEIDLTLSQEEAVALAWGGND
jgi:tRNA-dihydrouridine synthase B